MSQFLCDKFHNLMPKHPSVNMKALFIESNIAYSSFDQWLQLTEYVEGVGLLGLSDAVGHLALDDLARLAPAQVRHHEPRPAVAAARHLAWSFK